MENTLVTIPLVPKALTALDRCAGTLICTREEVVNRALVVYDILAAEMHFGKTLMLMSEDGRIEKVNIRMWSAP